MPLRGLRVLDLTTLFAAPQIGAMLGDLGADVVKLESPAGDPMRSLGAQRDGHSLQWAMLARNKRLLRLDLDREPDRELFGQLVERADVLVENLPVALLERWGCRYAELSARNPRLVVVSVTGYGRSGPKRDQPGAGSLAEAFGGLTHMTGEADGPPLLPSVPLGDTLAALYGVVGAISACYARDAGRRGDVQGQHVDVAMYEPVLEILRSSVAAWDGGRGAAPMRSGSRVAGGAPRNVYRTGDGYFVVVSGTTDAQVARLLGLLEIDDAAHRARFGGSASRLEHADELDARVASWIDGRSRDEVLAAFEAARIPIAPVQDVPALLADSHLRARGNLVSLDDPALGRLETVAPGPKLSGTPASIRHTGPVEAANAEVLRDWLELDPSALARLIERSTGDRSGR